MAKSLIGAISDMYATAVVPFLLMLIGIYLAEDLHLENICKWCIYLFIKGRLSETANMIAMNMISHKWFILSLVQAFLHGKLCSFFEWVGCHVYLENTYTYCSVCFYLMLHCLISLLNALSSLVMVWSASLFRLT